MLILTTCKHCGFFFFKSGLLFKLISHVNLLTKLFQDLTTQFGANKNRAETV
jgi:hypothetical protein